MPNKRLHPLPNGRRRRLAALSAELLLLAMLMIAGPAHATEAVVDYHLAIAFDLTKAALQGTAQLLVPAGRGVRLNVSGLEVMAVEVDGKAVPTPRQALLDLTPETTEQRLTVHYRKSYQGSHDNLISTAGIALTGLWHPQADQECRFHLQASLPADFEAISEADHIDTELAAGCKTQRFTLEQLLPGLTFVAGPYVVVKEPFADGKTLSSYFFAEDAELAAGYRQKAKAYLQRYAELIGPYPYQRFSIVENRLPTGYAMAGFTLLGQSVARLPFITDTSLGHEVLHSWFGNAVRVDQAQGNWCEGLTTYLADQAYAVDRGEGPAFRKDELLKYRHYVRPDAAVTVKDFHGAEPGREIGQLAERAVGYGKVAMIFRMLEQKIGHQRFVSGLQGFYRTMLGKRASWDDLRQAFAQAGEPLDAFFDQWLTRTDLPTLTANKVSLTEKEGAPTVSFTLHQGGDTPYRLEVPIMVFSASGASRHLVTTTTTDQEVVLTLPQEPTAMAIDPDYDLMRTLATAELPPSWDWFYGSAKKLAVVNSTAEYDRYQPLIDMLEAQGAEITAANEVTDAALNDAAVIFLGTSGPVPRALFANPAHPTHGLTVDIRQNPINPLYPMVLVTADNQAEVAAGLAKLSHYGKYGYLHFEGGRTVDKEVATAGLGITYGLSEEPTAVATQATQGFSAIIAQLTDKQVVYVGESHTRYEDHQLQLRVLRELMNLGKPLTIGMEMFPHASQPALDAFINGTMNEAEFLKASKYFDVWRFDYRLYREILNFARRNKIPVIGLNIDKESVSKVYNKGGVSGLSPEEAATLPVDRDLDIPGYRERIHEVYTSHPGRDEKQFGGFLQSQAIWDEIMAQTVVEALAKHPERQMVVLAGNGHVIKENAIPPRVARRRPVDQAVLIGAMDGTIITPAEADYICFLPASSLPPPAVLGIVMGQGKVGEPTTIQEVVANTPAEKAGIKKGDVILSVDGKQVQTPDDVKIILLDRKVGDTVKVTVQRPRTLFGSPETTVDVTL